MITMTLTAEYDPTTDQWKVLLPKGFDERKLVYSEPSIEEAMPDVELTWTDEEIAEMFKPPERYMTGAELVAWLNAEGGWEDMGITDSAEWSIAQRKKSSEG